MLAVILKSYFLYLKREINQTIGGKWKKGTCIFFMNFLLETLIEWNKNEIEISFELFEVTTIEGFSHYLQFKQKEHFFSVITLLYKIMKRHL